MKVLYSMMLLALSAVVLPSAVNAAEITAGENAAREAEIKTDYSKSKFKDPAQRSRVILVQPVILCDDDGKNPARWSIVKKLVDRCYARADLEFFYLEPRFWNKGKARRGEINLDKIVKAGKAEGMIAGGKEIVTMFFVDAIDGRAQLMGRGMLGGSITFVCLGKGEVKHDVNSFVIAHEVGHNLRLIHAVDDPKVPNDVPNVQGDGPYEDRLSFDGINDYQRDIILKTPLVHQRLHFSTKTESLELLLDQSHEKYIDSCCSACLRAMMAKSELPDAAVEAQQAAKKLLPAVATGFTAEEQQILSAAITRLEENCAKDWPLIKRFPWHFAKTSDEFCGGFPHTRGRHILLCANVIQYMKINPLFAETLLLHEKMHLIQRFFPRRFDVLYSKDYGFERLSPLRISAELNELVVYNPDAMREWWGLRSGKNKLYLPLTILTELKRPTMGRDFKGMSYPVKKEGASYVAQLQGGLAYPQAFPNIAKNFFWLRTGHDHPNEILAYTTELIYKRDYAKGAQVDKAQLANSAIIDKTAKTLKEQLKLK